METLLLGLLAAFAASVLYNLGLAIQALDARVAPPDLGFSPSLVTRLLRRRRWFFGSSLVALGWPFQAGALLLAPLTVVQPALAVGLLVLLVLGARVLGEKVGPKQALAVLAIIGGVTALALVAPEREAATGHGTAIAIALASLGALVALLYVAARFREIDGRGVALAAGIAYSWSAISTKLAVDAVANGHWTQAVAWIVATGIAAAVGLLSEMTALQRQAATQVGPLVFVVQTLVPVALAWPLVGESWGSTPGGGVPIVIVTLAIVVAATVLTRSPAVLGLTDHPGTGSDSLDSERAVSSDSSIDSSDLSAEAPPSRVTSTIAPARIRPRNP